MKKRLAEAKGGDSKSLTPEQKAQRKKIDEDRVAATKKEKVEMAARAKQLKANNDAQVGRDAKSLSSDTNAAREKKAEQSKEEQEKAHIAEVERAKQLKANNDAQ